MDFPESVKLDAKRRAHYQCVVRRRSVFLHVRHIVPQEEDGPGILDNAAPLCVECHDLHGNDPTKRKWLREARDFWWEHCAKQDADPAGLTLLARFDQLQTDVTAGRRELAEVKTLVVEQLRWAISGVSSASTAQGVAQAASATDVQLSHLEALRHVWPKPST